MRSFDENHDPVCTTLAAINEFLSWVELDVSDFDQTGDPLWRVSAYRLSLELVDQAWKDSAALLEHGNARSVADQLFRSAGSIGANLAEGYSRSSGADRVRMLEYALGSARECRFWYHAARRVMPAESLHRQQHLLNRICQLLLKTIPNERKRVIRRTSLNATDAGRRTQDA